MRAGGRFKGKNEAYLPIIFFGSRYNFKVSFRFTDPLSFLGLMARGRIRWNFAMRYLARKGIENWMVWDRKAHKPATINEKPAVKLSEAEARERAAELNGEPRRTPSEGMLT